MQKKSQSVFWPRAGLPGMAVSRGSAPIWALSRPRGKSAIQASEKVSAAGRMAGELRAKKFRELMVGLAYIGLFFVILFSEVYVRMQLKSRSLDVWSLSRRKAEIESEITRLDMRLTVLESPVRLESLALSEIGLTAAVPQEKTPTRKQ